MDDNLPRSHKEAMARPEAEQWREVEARELTMLHKLKVANFVPLPLGVHALLLN